MSNALGAENIAPQMLKSFEDLTAFLEGQSIPHRVVLEQQKVIIPTKMTEAESDLAILWGHEYSVIQGIHPLPFKVREEKVPDIESAIARINHALMFPGFGFDHKNRYAYYRLVIPMTESYGISVRKLEELLATCVKTSSDFCTLLLEVNRGAIEADEVLELSGLLHKKKVDGIF